MEPPRCRCCLSNETLTDMRANYFTARGDSNNISYLNAYLSLLAIPNESKLLEVSGMSTDVMNICIECSSHLESAYIFRQLCTDVNEMLKTQNDKMQKQNQVLAKNVAAVTAPTVVDDAETTFTATMKIISQVKVESDFEEQNDEYRESTTNPPSESIGCGQCDSRFKTVAGLNKHIIRTHQNDSYGQPAVEDTSYSNMMAQLRGSPKRSPTDAHCNSCARIFRTESGLARHMARQHSTVYRTFAANTSGGKFFCDECDKAFHHLSTLKLHREKHSTEKFQCPLCAANYKHSFNLKTHMTKKHKILKSQ